MCTNLIKVRSRKEYGVSYSYVPCKKCSECRAKEQLSWQTRLYAELEEYRVRRQWNVGFITLTYNDSHLPHIPQKFFPAGSYQKVPCFSYLDIKRFTDCIRNHLRRRYGVTDGFRFFITSEYGEENHRPHYHGILLFSPLIHHKLMYQIVEDAWCGSSIEVPQPRRKALKRDCLGAIDEFENFIPRDTYATGAYVAKYVCEDLAFNKAIDGMFDHLNKKARNHLRHFMPFHKQSLGFGAGLILGKSDEELLRMYEDGVQFTGQSRMFELPVYLKEKILFSVHKLYNLRTHKFESMKQYSSFLYKYRDKVYAKKLSQSRMYFLRVTSPDYWRVHSVQGDSAMYLYDTVRNIVDSVGIDQLARFFTLYYGVKYSACHIGDDATVWFQRYNPCADQTGLAHLDKEYYDMMKACCEYILSSVHITDTEARSEADELTARVRAFFNNMR